MKNDRARQIQPTVTPRAVTTLLAPGLILARTLRGPAGSISRIAWSPDGRLLATPSAEGTVQLWDVDMGEIVRTLRGHDREAFVVRFDPSGRMLASGGVEGEVMLWSVETGELIRRVGHHRKGAFALVFDPKTGHLISGGNDANVKIWNTTTGQQVAKLDGHNGSVNALALHPELRLLASGSLDTNVCIWDLDRLDLRYTLRGHRSSNLTVAVSPTAPLAISGNQDTTIRMWNMENGELIRELQVHGGMLQCVDCSPDGELIASKSSDGTLRLWSVFGGLLATVAEPTFEQDWAPGIAFHPSRPLLAIVASDPDEPTTGLDTHIHLYEYDASVLQGIASAAPPVLAYVTARVVLVGDSGVGKTALGWRLARGEFKQHPSTHGQQFWPLGQLGRAREDGAQCEAILWDLAGQPDYRLTHGLFLDDADLALILFDPTTPENPLRTAEFWLKQLRGARPAESLPSATPTPGTREAAEGRSHCPVILVAARADRGEGWLSADELATFCEFHGIEALHVTSALTNEGVPELLERMRALIAWDRQPATVTNDTFKRIRNRMFTLKESPVEQILVTPAELRARLETEDSGWRIADDELTTAIGHLATHGHVTQLTSKGQAWYCSCRSC